MSVHIAMWSGPRNISTAMMCAWSNRPDTVVCDEPLYAHYLLATGHTDHPGYTETVTRHEADWQKVVPWLIGPVPGGKGVFYQKHMAHHMLPGIGRDWLDKLTNCFLIRDPLDTLISLHEFLPSPKADATGLPQQIEMFEQITQRYGEAPPIVDAKDVLMDPVGMLRALCARVQVPFYEEMLTWPPGQCETDGAWAPYWYTKVYKTTTFGKYRQQDQQLPSHLLPVLEKCQKSYDELWRHRLRSNQQPATEATSAICT